MNFDLTAMQDFTETKTSESESYHPAKTNGSQNILVEHFFLRKTKATGFLL